MRLPRDGGACCRRAAAASPRARMGAASACARSTADLQEPHRRQLDHAPERRAQRVGEPVRGPEVVRPPAAYGPADDPRGPTSRPGSAGVDDRDRPDPRTQVLRQHGADVEGRRAQRRRASQSMSSTRVLRREPGRVRARGSWPTGGRRARARRLRRHPGAARDGAHRHGSPGRGPRGPEPPRSDPSTSSCGGSGNDSAHMRSTPSGDGLDGVRRKPMQVRRACGRATRAGMRGKRPRVVVAQSRPPAGVRRTSLRSAGS